MFRSAKNIAVLNSTLTEVHEGLNGRQILSQSRYVVHGAIHDSGQRYPPSECHPGTREDVLNIALGWANKPLDESESQVFWLSGPAGVGKTAIAQTLCQRLKELGRLGGDFFLSRSVSGHSDLHTLFPTLAYQLARAYPEFGQDLDAVVKADESILTKNMELQLKQLIVNPLKRVYNVLDIPLILVIDGLDEAGGESDQTSFLQLLCSSFLGHHLPLKIILTSRPEPWIRSAFDDNPLLGSSLNHFLHRTSQTDDDIRTVLNSGFAKIRKKHDLMKGRSNSWPSSEIIYHIVDRASGQFIYASTILRYIEDPNGNPAERLQRIIEIVSERSYEFIDSPFLALDNLYKHILSTSSNISRTLAILGVIIATFASQPIRDPSIAQEPAELVMMSFSISLMEQILSFHPGDGFLALRAIHSLVAISSDHERGVTFYHKSFQDFLLDSNRSGKYFIDMNPVNTTLVLWCLKHLRAGDFGHSESLSNQLEFYPKDLTIIEGLWVLWWLCSAASDEDRLLTEIKAIDAIAFYQNYAGNIARKVPYLLSNVSSYYTSEDIMSAIKFHCISGNIAESILLIDKQTTGGITFSFALERFCAAKAVFDKHFSHAQNLANSL